MVLIQCKECKKEMSNELKQCPHCSSNKHRFFFKKNPTITAILGLIVLGSMLNYFTYKSKIEEQHRQEEKLKQETVQKELKNQTEELKEPAKEEVKQETNTQSNNIVENWKYDINEDKMRKTKKLFAGIESSNTLDLGFPYNDSKLNIVIRKIDKETDVLLQVKGQFVCNSYSEKCFISVKSDDNSIVKYEFVESEHATMNVVFIKKSKEFIDMLKKSNKLIIETPLFDKGRVQYDFNSAGLKWEE